VPARPDVARRKLLELDGAVGRLRSWLPISIARLRADLRLPWAVEHGRPIAAEALCDVRTHILAGEFSEVLDEHRAIAPHLAARGIIGRATAARLESRAGCRNGLVHGYAAVDLAPAHAALDRLGDGETFVSDMADWLRRPGRPA
jgi:uncharacterized protein YutE (UPF0331/DUF86 family)